MSSLSRVLVGGAVVAAFGCQVEWGGGQISLENPAPPPDTTSVVEPLAPEQLALPDGPFLFAVSLDGAGRARLLPIAAITEDDGKTVLVDVEIMQAEDPTFRARFDSVFLAPSRELELLARGRRLGSVVIEGVSQPGSGTCPSVAAGRAMLVPGQDVPPLAFAVAAGLSGFDGVDRVPPIEPTRSMDIAGPVLAERLIGGDRAFLAQLRSRTPVALAGDTLAAMAATWLIADSLAAGPPSANAISLFFLARFEPARGFIPLWEEVRRYDSAGDKEILEFLEWIQLGDERFDVLKRYDASTTRLAISITGPEDDRDISWIESRACNTLGRLGR